MFCKLSLLKLRAPYSKTIQRKLLNHASTLERISPEIGNILLDYYYQYSGIWYQHSLNEYIVVPQYAKFDENERNMIKEIYQKLSPDNMVAIFDT